METTRLIVILSLAVVGMMLWQAWERDYGQRASPPTTSAPEAGAVPELAAPVVPETPPAGPGAEIAPSLPEASPVAESAAPRITIETDVLRLEIGSRGAGIRRAELLHYPVSLEHPDEPFVLLNDSGPDFYVTQGGLLSRQPAPTDAVEFQNGEKLHRLPEKTDRLEVPFTWSEGGIAVRKIYELRRGSYEIGVRYEIDNGSAETWQGNSYSQIQRVDPGRAGRRVVYTYVGAVLSSPEERYQKIDFDQMRKQKLDQEITDGWAAMLQHYFVTALIPGDAAAAYRYYTIALPDERFVVGAVGPAITVAPGASGRMADRVYVGPKLQHVLRETAEGLDLTVDYGALWFIAKPLFWCLEQLRNITGNWGWAIVLVTVMLKLAFYHLSAAGYRSMANMRRVQPRLLAIRDRYKNDRARLNQAMMQIYKEEKINPFGGCLPIVIQIPVFIALYWVLLESVELRQSGFILWLHDLSTPDPYWVLPILMGITMFVQQRLNPAPMDPVQQKVMQIMPFAFTIFFGFFPSGLVLYWLVNNMLSIGQQWLITRSIERAAAGAEGKP
ncbi:MAG: membrane protein insertase YidC [Gammaproteobacteria bacterium]|nr:membrane protein insertase YidC [Gammaproteobacteria bacterium]